MDIFDPYYDVEMNELIFTEHNKNIFIYGQIIYVLYENYKTISFYVDTLIHDE